MEIEIERLRQECFVIQRELNEERAKLADQEYRFKNEEARLAAKLAEWKAAREMVAA